MATKRRNYRPNYDVAPRPRPQQGIFRDMGDIPGGGSEDRSMLVAALGAALFRVTQRYRGTVFAGRGMVEGALAHVELVQEGLKIPGEWDRRFVLKLISELDRWAPPYTYFGQFPGGDYPVRYGYWPLRERMDSFAEAGYVTLIEASGVDDLPDRLTQPTIIIASTGDDTGSGWIARYSFWMPVGDDAALVWEWFPGMTRRTTTF